MKYANMLKLCKEKANELLAPMRANEMRKGAELEIAKIESTIASQEQRIEELCSTYPIDFDRVIDSIDELELVKLRKERFEELLKGLF